MILVGYQHQLTQGKNELQENLFERMAKENSNFLWQLSFFVLQKIHLILLCSIFAIGMDDINVYYIGLLYFFMKYVSSVQAYRKSGSKLVMFTAFFIWAPYIWKLIKSDFYKKDTEKDFFYKLMQMITLAAKE